MSAFFPSPVVPQRCERPQTPMVPFDRVGRLPSGELPSKVTPAKAGPVRCDPADDAVSRALATMLPAKIRAIQREVAEIAGVTIELMLSPCRTRRVTYARQLAMYRCRMELRASFPRIARAFGRDHTTVLHAIAAVERRQGFV